MIHKKIDNKEKRHGENRGDGKREKKDREWEKEINGAENACSIRDYISFIYFSIFVNNMIFCESFHFEMGKVILI